MLLADSNHEQRVTASTRKKPKRLNMEAIKPWKDWVTDKYSANMKNRVYSMMLKNLLTPLKLIQVSAHFSQLLSFLSWGNFNHSELVSTFKNLYMTVAELVETVLSHFLWPTGRGLQTFLRKATVENWAVDPERPVKETSWNLSSAIFKSFAKTKP